METVSFMTAWWPTVVFFALVTAVSGAVSGDGVVTRRTRRVASIVFFIALSLFVVSLGLGIWLPALIPGLY